jgi:hypothetical protein
MLWLLNYREASRKHAFLRILHLSAFPTGDNGDMATHYGPHLHSLRTPNVDFQLIESARSLKEIFLFDGREITVEFLLLLPPSVEHIAFSLLDGTYALEHIFQVKGNGVALDNLKVLSLHRQMGQTWPKLWTVLANRARNIGIELIRQENRGFLVGGVSIFIH